MNINKLLESYFIDIYKPILKFYKKGEDLPGPI